MAKHSHLQRVYENLRRAAGGSSSPLPEGEGQGESAVVSVQLTPPSEANIERTRQFFAKEFKLDGQGNSKQKEAYRLGVLFFALELDAAEKRGEERALRRGAAFEPGA